MSTTHGFVGALIGLGVAGVTPVTAPVTVAVGFVGGLFPDLDMVATHRRSLHFPWLATIGAFLAILTTIVLPKTETFLLSVFFVAVAVHCTMDIFGGGVELRPWEQSSERGVYNHVTGRWIKPRRWVRFAGAPEDFLLGATVALPTILFVTGRVRLVLVVALVASGAFTAIRRHLADITERLFGEITDDSARDP